MLQDPGCSHHFHATMETLLQDTQSPGSLSGLITLRLSPQRLQLCRTTQVSSKHTSHGPACVPLHVVPVIPRIALDLGFAWAILTQMSALETAASSWPTAFPRVPFLHSGEQAKAFSVILLPCCIPAMFFPLSLPVDTPCVFLSLQG